MNRDRKQGVSGIKASPGALRDGKIGSFAGITDSPTRLDALYFHLYGLSRADAAYILDTIPFVRRHDKPAFGRHRTKSIFLAYYNAPRRRRCRH